jgi:hypothetical protein
MADEDIVGYRRGGQPMKNPFVHLLPLSCSLAVCVGLSACSARAEVKTAATMPTPIRLSQVTQYSANKDVGNPVFLMPGHGEGDSPFLIWRESVQDKARPGQLIFEPRQTYWCILGSAVWRPSKFIVLKEPLEFWRGQSSGGPNVEANFSIVDCAEPASQSPDSPRHLLFHTFIVGGGVTNSYRIAVQPIQASPSTLKVVANSYSELPRNCKDPEYLKAVAKYRSRLEAYARERGHRVVDGKEGVRAVPGDLLFQEESVISKLNFLDFCAARDTRGNIWLTGLDYSRPQSYLPRGDLWVTHSRDGGRTWEPRLFIGHGVKPTITGAANGDLLVFWSQIGRSVWTGNWPDYHPVITEPAEVRRGYRQLVMQRSHDGGKTWSKPMKVTGDDAVLQNRIYRAQDGRLWLVYVHKEQAQHTSLWLTSSMDNGRMWQKPQRITEGKNYDRDPDIIEHQGQVLIAFARSQSSGGTNIWVAALGR